MRKLIFAINMTLDGCVDHTKGSGSEEILKHYAKLLQDADTEIFGRKTYELMVPYWPQVAKDPSQDKVSIEFAQAFCSLSKVVFSRTLSSVEDANTRVASGNLRGEILKLKQEDGKSILVGGVDLSCQLVELGLVDEFRILVLPVVVGAGRRLWDNAGLPEKLKVKLVESKALDSGAFALRYVKQ